MSQTIKPFGSYHIQLILIEKLCYNSAYLFIPTGIRICKCNPFPQHIIHI